MEVLFSLICFLIGLIAALAFVAVVGHALWLAAAAVFSPGPKRSFGEDDPPRRRRGSVACVGCGERFYPYETTCCPYCDLDPKSRTAGELRDLNAAERAVQRLYEIEDLPEATCEQVFRSIEARRAILAPTERRPLPEEELSSAPAPVAPRPEPAPTPKVIIAAPLHVEPPLPVFAPMIERNPPAKAPRAPLVTVEEAPIPPVVQPPRRTFAEWIGVFMEEKNILWGELIGGLLIIGCSIALVISLWQTLENIPFFPFLIFTAITSALFAAGFYTLHHWKLESTSRGLLLIGTLLVPLDFLVLAGLSHQMEAGALNYIAGACALGLFGFLLERSARILVQTPLDVPAPSALLVTAAILISAAAQLATPRWADQPGAFPVYLLSLLPVLAQGGALGWILFRMNRLDSWSVARLAGLLIALGSVTFACAVTLCVPLSDAEDWSQTLLHLSPALTLLGVPILIAGIMIQRKLDILPILPSPPGRGTGGEGEEPNALWRTLGTALALAGLFIMLGGFVVSVNQLEHRWFSGMVNVVTLLATAWLLRVPVLHVPAQVYLAVLVVAGGSFSLDEMVHQPAAALRLTGLFVVQAIVAEVWMRLRRRVDARLYAVGAGVSTVLAGILIFPFAKEYSGTTALILATAVLTWLASNLRWRYAELTYGCALVLAGAIFFTLRHFYGDGAVVPRLLWTMLTHATVCSLGGILLRFAAMSRPPGLNWLHDAFRTPLELAGLLASSFGAAFLIVEQSHHTLTWTVSSAACGWLALLWLTLAVLEGWPVLFGAFQVALAAAWFFAASAYLKELGWAWLEPYSLHICALGIAFLSLAWKLARIAARSSPRALALLAPPFVPIDRLMSGGLVIGQYVLMASLVLGGFGNELSATATDWRVFPLAWYQGGFSIAAWLLPVLLAGVLIAWWREILPSPPGRGAGGEGASDTRPMLLHASILGCTLLLLTIPLLAAGTWFDETKAVASAARWGLALCYGFCSLLLWNRRRLASQHDSRLPLVSVRVLLACGAVLPVLLISAYVVVMKLTDQILPGPLDESIFIAMKGATSLLFPLVLLSAVLAGHGIRERLAHYLLLSGSLANVSAVGAFFLALQEMNLPLNNSKVALDALLLAAGVAWIWSIAWTALASWLEKGVSRPLLGSPLLTFQAILGAGLYGLALLPAFTWVVFFRTDGAGRLLTLEAGSVWSWLAWGLMAAGSCFCFQQRRAAVPVHLLGALTLTAVGVSACTFELFLPGTSFRALMFGSGLYSCLWVWGTLFLDRDHPPGWLLVTRGLRESAVYAVAAGGLAVLLGCATFNAGTDRIWSADAIVLAALAAGLLAYQRKTEIWASLAAWILVLASTIFALEFDRGNEFLPVHFVQIALATLGGTALLHLGLRHLITPPDSELTRLKNLPLRIGVGMLAYLGLPIIGLMALVIAPDRPGPWLQIQADPTGWLALLTNVTAAIWYISLVRPRWLVDVVALGGLLLGIVLAASADSWIDRPWLAHNVLTLSWTSLALGLLIASWVGSAQAAADFLKRSFPETTTRAWVTLGGALVVALALREAWLEPGSPYCPVADTLAVSVLLGAMAVWSRDSLYVFGSGLMFNVVGISLYFTWQQHLPRFALEEFFLAQVLCFGIASIVWSLIERRLRSISRDIPHGAFPPFTQVASLAGIGLMVADICGRTALFLQGDHLDWDSTPLTVAWIALGVLGVAAILDLLRPQAERCTRLQLYLCGLLAIGLLLQTWPLSITHWWLAATLLLAAYVLLIVVLSRLAFLHPMLQNILHPSETETGEAWFWPVQLGSIGLVLLLSMWIALTLGDWQERLAGALAGALVTTAVFLLVPAWPLLIDRGAKDDDGSPRYLVLSLGLVIALETCFAFLSPETSHVWLQRSAALLAVVMAGTLAYRLVLPLRLAHTTWALPTRRLSAILAAGSVALLLVLLPEELVTYDVVKRTTPLLKVLAIVVGLGILGLMGLALYCVEAKEADPYGIEHKWRSSYVYLAELLLVAFLIHVRLNLPFLIPRLFGAYWYLPVMVLAFAAVALSEILTRKNLPIFATPLYRTAILLAFIPVLAFRVAPVARWRESIIAVVPGLNPFLMYLTSLSALYHLEALCWLLLGIFFGTLAQLRRSANYGLLGALAVNFGVWVLLGNMQATEFLERPQLWLIPLGLIILLAEYVNRRQLGFWPSLWVRYGGLMCIYLSSTIEMLKEPLDNVYLALALLLLAVAGMLLGILFRVRAFLLTGFTALLVVLFAQIWNAAVHHHNTWVWWASGIVLGVAILSLFALFEKHRNEVLKMLDTMKRWH